MTELADWIETWLDHRALPRGVTPSGLVVAAVERDEGGATRREVRCGRTGGAVPLLVLQVHSTDRIAPAHAAQVHATCNRWNAGHRLPRAWLEEREAGLRVVLETSLPAAALTEAAVARAGDATVDGAVSFWRSVDLEADW
jgi:hypothetical protein